MLPKSKKNAKALIVEGGGMKGAFSGGALYGLGLVRPVTYYDLVVGVSSGACSAAYYVTMPKPDIDTMNRNLEIWRTELAGRNLISVFHPLMGKTFLNQNFLIDDLFRYRYRLPAEILDKKKIPPFYIAVTNIRSRQVEFLQATKHNIFHLLKAATSLPIATKGRQIVDSNVYSDAALMNPLPVRELLDAGYKKITVVLNSPIRRISAPLSLITSFLSFPFDRKMGRLMQDHHHTNFNGARDLLQNPPQGIEFEIIAPGEKLPVQLVSTNKEKLRAAVQSGIDHAFAVTGTPDSPRKKSASKKQRKKTPKKKAAKKKNSSL